MRLRVELLAILETHRRLIDSLVPEDAPATPVGFFEVGTPRDYAPDVPLAYAEEPVRSLREDSAHDTPETEEPEAPAEDQGPEEAAIPAAFEDLAEEEVPRTSGDASE